MLTCLKLTCQSGEYAFVQAVAVFKIGFDFSMNK